MISSKLNSITNKLKCILIYSKTRFRRNIFKIFFRNYIFLFTILFFLLMSKNIFMYSLIANANYLESIDWRNVYYAGEGVI